MDNKVLNYLAIAKKGRLAELGEEPVGAVARAMKAHLIIVAGDASDHTWRRAKSFAAGTDQQCIRLDCTKEEMGFVVGRTSLAIAAITDVQLALALVTALNQPEKHKAVLEVLTAKAEKAKNSQVGLIVDSWLKIISIGETDGVVSVVVRNISDADVQYALLTVNCGDNTLSFPMTTVLAGSTSILKCDKPVEFDGKSSYYNWKVEEKKI